MKSYLLVACLIAASEAVSLNYKLLSHNHNQTQFCAVADFHKPVVQNGTKISQKGAKPGDDDKEFQDKKGGKAIEGYVPPGDLAKGKAPSPAADSKDPHANTKENGVKVDLEKKFNPYYQGKDKQATGEDVDMPRQLQDPHEETGGKWADKIEFQKKQE